jgi:hypothetical protein|tara:strand:- start:3778 stop:4128 length:351 start_codon:yes stop_codon:yes gene_type:complete
MAKLLRTSLPFSYDGQVSADLYNRLLRILEINLGEFDPDNTRQITTEEKLDNKFNLGAIVFDTTLEKLQVYDGDDWLTIATVAPAVFSGPPTNGLEAQASLGTLSVSAGGDITITL